MQPKRVARVSKFLVHYAKMQGKQMAGWVFVFRLLSWQQLHESDNRDQSDSESSFLFGSDCTPRRNILFFFFFFSETTYYYMAASKWSSAAMRS